MSFVNSYNFFTKLLKFGCRPALQKYSYENDASNLSRTCGMTATLRMIEAFSSHAPYEWNLLY